MKIFKNLYSQWNFPKFDYKKPVWVNSEIISSLKKRSKLSKKHYNNPKNNNNKTLLVNKGNEGIKLILLTKFMKVTTGDHHLNFETANMRHRFWCTKVTLKLFKRAAGTCHFKWTHIFMENFSAGVQQGSVWGPYFFLNYINTLTYQVR